MFNVEIYNVINATLPEGKKLYLGEASKAKDFYGVFLIVSDPYKVTQMCKVDEGEFSFQVAFYRESVATAIEEANAFYDKIQGITETEGYFIDQKKIDKPRHIAIGNALLWTAIIEGKLIYRSKNG